MKKKLTVLALAFAMVLTMSASVFATADGVNSGDNNGADSYLPGSAKLVKYLTIAENVTVPTETFAFTFTPVEVSPANDMTVPAASHPAVSATIASSALSQIDDSTNYKAELTIASIFDGKTFPRAGEYTYTVAETEGSTTGMTYSSDSYTLRLIVDKDGNIDDVTVQKGENGDKVDPTDVDPEEASDDNKPSGSTSGFTFTNNYVKLVDTHPEPNPDYDPTDPDSPEFLTKEGALKVEKLVTGEYGDYTKDFNFNVNVDIPDNTTGYTLADNEPSDKAIKSGESFSYAVLPAGSKITITETEANQAGYTTTAEGTKNAVTLGTEFVLSEDGQFVKVTNAFDDESVTPTGIIINNLPYVLLIGLALGGIVLFSRKRRYE